MSLAAGTRLGAYEVIAPLGAGGMGEVYRARDTRLDRVVAIKVLPPHLAADPQFRQRFEHEARAISALDHPHICALYDVGDEHGTSFLVMQYLEGETLADRLTKGAVPLAQALQYAIQIAGALDTAHRAGIVHRDLKPGNVMLTPVGAKLLDFGLAKASTAVAAGTGLSMLPTTPPGLTAQGTILGTFQYMAPEQLEGREADARTDVFAFGAVVYEMLTGKKAFEGKSQASLIGAIMHAEPAAISASQPLTPPALDRIVKTCLAKDPDDRWQSARDLSHELQWVRHDPTSTAVVASKKGWRLAWALGILLGMGLGALGIRQIGSRESNPHVARFTIAAPAGTSLPPPGSAWSPSISPDGTWLVFQAARQGEPLLAVRPIDAVQSRVLPGTERALFPFWSPDSRVVAFFADGKLKRINVSGGPIQTICDAEPGLGGTWNRQGTIVFLRSQTEGFYRVPAAGGVPTALISPKKGEGFRFRPQFLPDGRRFLYAALPDSVYLASLDGGAATQVLTGTPMALYAQPGYLLFYQGRTLVAQRFDSDLTGRLGDPVPIGEDVVTGPPAGGGGAPFSVSDNGVLAYKTVPAINRKLVWFDRAGRPVSTIGPFPFGDFGAVELSPDGAQLAMQSPNGPTQNSEIWLFDLAQGQPKQLTFTGGADRRPIWSPDSRRLVFASSRQEGPGLYQKSAGGEHSEELLLRSRTVGWEEHWPADWSPKGILYESGIDNSSIDLWILPVDGDRKPYPVVREGGTQSDAKVSPNARWLAYTHREPLRRREVFVQSLSPTGAKWRISTAGGRWPRWRADGKELFYLAADGNLIAVPIEADATSLRLGVPKTLFKTELSVLGGAGVGSFVVSPDGQRFLIRSVDDEDSNTASIIVVTNWPAALQR